MTKVTSVLSLRSRGSFLSICSDGSILSVGSIGSVCSIGSIGSAFSIGSIGSVLSVMSMLSTQSNCSVLSHRSNCSILCRESSSSILSHPGDTLDPRSPDREAARQVTTSVGGAPGASGEEPGLTAEQFQRLASYGERRTVHAGQVLYATGDSSYDLFLIESAAVDVVREESITDREHVVYARTAGDFMGELSILTGQTVYVTARVRKPGLVVQIGAQAFRTSLAEQVDIADVLIEAFRLRRRIMLDSAGSALEIVGQPDTASNRALRTYAARLQLPHSPVRSADSVAGRSIVARPSASWTKQAPRCPVRSSPGQGDAQDVARAVGLTFEPSDHDVDLVVVGAGPAGLAAAVYGTLEGLVTVLLDAPGSRWSGCETTSRIENYLGFPGGISGDDLTRLALVQALKFGAQVYAPCHVVGLRGEPRGPVLTLADGSEVRARAVIVATGARYRRLAVARWDEFERRGAIRYSATELDVAGCGSAVPSRSSEVPTQRARPPCSWPHGDAALMSSCTGTASRSRCPATWSTVWRPATPSCSCPDERPSPGAVRRGGSRGVWSSVPTAAPRSCASAGGLFCFIGAETRHRLDGRRDP